MTLPAALDHENYQDVGTLDAEDVPPPLMGLSLAELTTFRFPDRRALLTRGDAVVLREGHLGEVFGDRGLGKSWFLTTLGLVMASGGHALGFQAPEPCRVLLVDGEMGSQEIQERCAHLCARLGLSTDLPLTIVAQDWQERYLPRLDTMEGQILLDRFIDDHDAILLDNRSCLFDAAGEKDVTAWAAAQNWLLSLRRRGKAVLMAHHANRMGGARGISKAEDPLNLIIQLARPQDYQQDQGARFEVTFTKSRGAHGPSMAPFLAHLTLDGWQTDSLETTQGATVADKLLEYLHVAHAADERPKSANAAIAAVRVNRGAGLKAWTELKASHRIRQHHDGGWFCV